MAETIVHTGEAVVDGTVTGLAAAVGSLTNEVAHHAETIAEHTKRLAYVDDDARYIKERLEGLAQTVTDVPNSAIVDLQQAFADLRQEVTAQMAALSDAIADPGQTKDPETIAPPDTVNDAVPKKPGGLRGVLHRLL
jgi:uncharacterized protein YoxC